MKQPQTKAQLINTAERRAYVLNLRRGGADYRAIAQQVIDHLVVEFIQELLKISSSNSFMMINEHLIINTTIKEG